MDWISLLAILLSLLLIGFFYGISVAFAASNKLSIEILRKQGRYSGRIWGRFGDRPSVFIGTVLVTVNIFIIIYGLLVGELLYPIWRWIEGNLPQSAADYVKFIRLLVETILATAIILLIEFSFKALFRANGSSLLRSGFIAFVMNLFSGLIGAISALLISSAKWILKYVLNVKLAGKKEIFTRVDTEYFLQQRRHTDSEDNPLINKELFENALSIGEVKLRDCLIPRKEIEAVDINTPIRQVTEKFIESRLSRLLVYEQNIDNIAGYVHQLDLMKNPSVLKEIIHHIPAVPETMTATDMMNKFSKERKSIAWVVDEFGGTAGIVTMEDLLEELFGEIKDEYDEIEEFVEKQIAGDEYLFSGRLELDYLSNKYGLDFPEENNSETLSGLIIQINEGIPEEKKRIIFGKFEFDIISTGATRIDTVKVKVLR